VGVTNYVWERQIPGSTSYAQVGTTAGLAYNDTALTASASYSYRVRATDAAGNFGAYSGLASATTLPATPPPGTTPSMVMQNFNGLSVPRNGDGDTYPSEYNGL